MYLSKIKIKNFKSFSNVSVNLKDFNVFVGESASGKSNFIESLMFLKNLSLNSLQAINNHGGFFIQNLKHESNSPTCIRAVLIDDEYNICLNYPISENNMANIYFKSIDYEICINYNKNNLDFVCESIKFDFEIYDKSYSDSSLLFKNSLILKNDNGNVSSIFKNVDDNLNLEFFTPKSLINIINSNFKRKVSLLINSPLSSFPFDWANYFKEIHFYDFNPKVSKSVYGNGNINLSKDGENLALVLDNILNVKDNKRKFINLSSSLLPYIKDIGVENISDGKIFKLFEKYDKKPIFSPFISDGTVNVIALITALYFIEGNIIFIEEPEKNIHPRLFLKLVNMMKEISRRDKQIIITTHSPEILDYCDLVDIQLISRDENGFSIISQPKYSKDVVEFVEELGIGHVFLNNYLGV